MSKKIFVITDMDSSGSGYRNVCTPLFTELAKLGHDIKVAGLMYRGEEHNLPFSIIPAQNLQETIGITTNMMQLWNPDVLVVALDLPIQGSIYNQFAPYKKKYIAITPMENGPLCMSWAVPLFQMDKVFFISELATQEAKKVGLTNVEHLQIGVDTVSWHPATAEEKSKLREGLGIPQDAFVVLTVADNQERKNLWAGLRAIAHLKNETERSIRYVLVTRIDNPYGYKLRDLINTEGIKEEAVLFERGMSTKDLWGLYAIADAYLQPSKAEGLGLPVLDAMACGVLVVATKTGALVELLEDERGYLIDGYEFDDENWFIDVWGNSRRVMINIQQAKNALLNISQTDPKTRGDINAIRNHAFDYVCSRTWDIPAKQFEDALRKMFNE